MRTLADANGNTAYFHYDGYDRRQYWVMPSRTATGAWDWTDYEYYGYDLVGNRTALRKRDGSVLGYQYDALGRMTRKTVPERPGLDPVHTRDVYYGYDLRNLQTFARFDSPTGEGVAGFWDGGGALPPLHPLALSSRAMDETFQLRARRRAAKRQPAALDYAMLTAALAAQRAAHAAAHPSGQATAGAAPAGADPLTEIVLAGPDWQRAASAQRGCFNRAEVTRRRNTP